MADRVRRKNVEKLPNLNANWYLRFFGVADYEKTKNLKNKIKDEGKTATSTFVSLKSTERVIFYGKLLL